MALTRKTKIWLVVVSIPVVLLVGAGVALKLMFTSDRLKSIVVPKVEEATNRKVTLNDISLSVFPTLGIKIDGLTIANRQGPGFSAEKPFLSLNKLILDIKTMALLRGNLEITEVIIDKPQILLEINEDGIANYVNENVPPAGAVKDTGRLAMGLGKGGGLLLSNFRIIGGSFDYINRKENTSLKIEGFHQLLTVEIVPVANEAHIESKTALDRVWYGSLKSSLLSDIRVNVNSSLLYKQDTDLLTIQQGECIVQAIRMQVAGTVANASKAPTLDLKVSSEKLNVADLLSLLPRAYIEKMKGMKGTGTANVKIAIKGVLSDSTQPDAFGNISTTDGTIQFPQLPKPITNIRLVSSFTRTKTKQEFNLEKATATLGTNPISMTMKVVNFDSPSLTMTMNGTMNLAEVKDYYPLEAGTEMAGGVKANVNIAGKVSKPDAMVASGTMEFASVTVKTASSKNPVQNLNGGIIFNNQVLESKKISMMIGKSDITLAFTMKNYLSTMSTDRNAPKPTARATLTSNHIYTADITGDEKGKGQPGGQAGGTQQPPAKKGSMPLPNVDMDIAADIGTLTMERFELKNVKGTMRISNGIITMPGLTFNTFEGTVTTKGTINMQKPERPVFDMDVAANGVQANGMLSKFTSFGQRLFGELSMSTTLKGTLDDTLGLVPSSLIGRGDVKAQSGRLQGVKVNQQLASMLKVPDLETINFKDWTNGFTINDGRVQIPELKINALGADYLVKGSQGLDGTMDFGLAMLLSPAASAKVSVPGFAGEAVNALKEPDGRVKLDFLVGGTVDGPKVSLNTQSLQARAADFAKQKLDAEKQKLQQKLEGEATKKQDELKKKGEDVLKDLFKKKK